MPKKRNFPPGKESTLPKAELPGVNGRRNQVFGGGKRAREWLPRPLQKGNQKGTGSQSGDGSIGRLVIRTVRRSQKKKGMEIRGKKIFWGGRPPSNQ